MIASSLILVYLYIYKQHVVHFQNFKDTHNTVPFLGNSNVPPINFFVSHQKVINTSLCDTNKLIGGTLEFPKTEPYCILKVLKVNDTDQNHVKCVLETFYITNN